MELWIDLRRVDREGTDRPDRADASLYFGHRRFLPDQVSRHARTTIRGAVISNVRRIGWRSEEHTSELQSLMRISYAVFCLKKKKLQQPNQPQTATQPHK